MDDRFDRAKALFVAGVGHYEAGRFVDAETAFEASLQALPGRPSTLANLGATRLRLGRPEAALQVLDEALAVSPDDLDALSHRGAALAVLGRHGEALADHARALALAPGRVVDAFGQAAALATLGRSDEAIAAFDATLALAPQHAEAWSQRGSVLREAGRLAEAKASYEQAIAHGGDADANGYFLAALDGSGPSPMAPPQGYVETLFDHYAGGFGAHLVEALGYRAPQELARGLALLDAEAAQPERRYASGLDLGCGSGLCAPALAVQVAALDGVDLSSRMIEQARAGGLYRRLDRADLVAWLDAADARYELVIAADVFIYVGALDRAFAGVRRVLAPGGRFCFSVEKAADGEPDWVLRPSLRYAHTRQGVEALAARTGFRVDRVAEAPIRDEQRVPVDGLYVYLS